MGISGTNHQHFGEGRVKTARFKSPFGDYYVDVPLNIYVGGERIETDDPHYDDTLWVERGEDWYGLSSIKRKKPNSRVLVVKREDFIRARRKRDREAKQ